jgi:hypothetical protein
MQELAPGARALAVVCRRGDEGVDSVVAAGVGEVVETDVWKFFSTFIEITK